MSSTGYRIDVGNYTGEVTAFHGTTLIAASDNVKILRETRLPNCYYFPKSAIDPALLLPSQHRTFCPFKGTATYWHLALASGQIENAVWCYETPLEESVEIGNHLSFTRDAVDSYSFSASPPPTRSDGHIDSALSDWILREAGYCATREELVKNLGRKFVDSGIAVFRINITIWSLHPMIAGVNFIWHRDSDEVVISEPSYDLFTNPAYLNSPLNLVTKGLGGVRQLLNVDEAEFKFSIMQDLKDQGATDYVAMPLRFSDGKFHSMTLTSDHVNGFTTQNLGLIFECVGVISRFFEVLTLRANQVTLLDTYLGPRTGQKVLEGDIRRGKGENIQAVILFSDLRNSSRLAETLPRAKYLQLLNLYFETILGPITENGGEVLKFIGDAVLAIFPVKDNLDDRANQAQKALLAARQSVDLLIDTTSEQLLDVDFGIALHIGEVTYGNVGSQDRLDFTVIGPAVNLASRIEDLCKSTGHRILLSSDFKTTIAGNGELDGARLCNEPTPALQPIGTHQLPGITDKQQIFAIK